MNCFSRIFVFLLFVASLQMLGCAAMQPKNTLYPFEAKPSREFHVAKSDFSNVAVTDNEILSNLARQLEGNGHFNPLG